MSKRNKKDDQPDILQSIIIGLGKLVWWLITLPFRKTALRKSRFDLTVRDKNYIVEKRLEIEKILRSDNDIELRHAVLEADKIVDYMMRAQGYSGETFADRIRSAESHISQSLNNDVWLGHKVRNQIAHENNVQITHTELRSAAEKLLKYTKNI